MHNPSRIGKLNSTDPPTHSPIHPPTHLFITRPAALIKAEKSDTDAFQPVPFYFMEICCLLFESAKDAFGDDFFKVLEVAPSCLVQLLAAGCARRGLLHWL